MSMVFIIFSFKIHIIFLVQNAIPKENTAIYRRIMPKVPKKIAFSQYNLLY